MTSVVVFCGIAVFAERERTQLRSRVVANRAPHTDMSKFAWRSGGCARRVRGETRPLAAMSRAALALVAPFVKLGSAVASCAGDILEHELAVAGMPALRVCSGGVRVHTRAGVWPRLER